MRTHFLRTCAVPIVYAALLAAARAQTTPEMTFRPSLLSQTALSYSYAASSGVRNDVAQGGSAVHHFDTSTSNRTPMSNGSSLSEGMAFSINWIKSDAAVPAPRRLGELSLNLGYMRPLSPEFTLMAFARPGYYADFSHCTWATVNVPVMAMVSYTPSPKYTWLFGAGFNPFSQYMVMPAIGLRWKIAGNWTLNLGLPRFGVTWQVSGKYDLGAYITGQGGSFRTTTAPVGPGAPARDNLANTYVDYREFRVGLRATIKNPDPKTKGNTSVEIGCMLRRNFDYYRRDYNLREGPAFYVTISAGGNGANRM